MPLWLTRRSLHHLIEQGQSGLTDQEHAQFMIDVVKATHSLPPADVATWFLNARNVKDEASRLQLGRDFLAVENVYQTSKDPADYQQFVQTILQSANVFNVKDKPLIARAAFDQKFDAVRSRLPADWSRFTMEIDSLQQGWPQVPAARAAFLRSTSPCSTAERSTNCWN